MLLFELPVSHSEHKEEFILECDICHYSIPSYREYSLHRQLHLSQPQGFVCHLCYTVISRKDHLLRHMRTRHPPSGEFPVCTICSRSFRGRKSLARHMRARHIQLAARGDGKGNPTVLSATEKVEDGFTSDNNTFTGSFENNQ
ncbi:uncharacterized protein LOC143258707 isoform X1 [Tachypleus tridentatus]|uniref:uncharacterized protein LOC143258707 isoform X1 n=1 Tax=Tachypleus tridentatus TaxID=6853 RepID=UPI003FD06E10